MPTTFPLDTQAQFVGGSDDDERTVANGGPGTVYHDNERTVSSLLNDGSIASGASKTFWRPTWLATGPTPARVTVEDEALASETEHTAELAVLSETPINVKYPEYGAVGDGVADDAPAIRAAIDAAGGSGIVFLPAGTYLLNSHSSTLALPLPRDAAGLTIRGAGPSTVIKLSSNCKRAFDMKSTADDQTFQNIAIEDLTVDGDDVAITYNEHGILGNLIGGGWGQRVNFSNIRVSRVRAINFPVQTGGSDPSRMLVSLVSTQSATGQAVNTIEDVLVEDCDFTGGNTGVLVAGFYTGSAGSRVVFLDNIVVRGLRHNTGVTPAAAGLGAHIQIGSYGYGRSCTVRDCIGFNSIDVGVEINAMTSALVDNCEMYDSQQAEFLHTNFRAPEAYEKQRVEFRDCRAYGTNANDSGYHFVARANNSLPLGTVVLRGCKVYTNQTRNGIGAGFDTLTNLVLSRLVIDDFEVIQDGVTHTSGTIDPSAIRITLINSGVAPPVEIRNVRLRFAGTRSGGTVNYTACLITGKVALNVDGMVFDWAFTSSTAGGLRGIEITSGTTGGTIRGLHWLQASDDTGPYGLIIRGTASLTIGGKLRIVNSDFSAFPAGGTEVLFAATSNAAKTVFRDNTWKASSTALDVASAATITVPDTPRIAVTGTTTITSVAAIPAGGGPMTFVFADVLTFTDGSNLKLLLNLVTTADDTITLICDGTNWHEVARSVN